jgi:peptide/nickel transport system ATP-binding protein
LICAGVKTSAAPVLSLSNLTKTYAGRRSMLRRNEDIVAIADVSLTLAAGSTTAIVGQSGAGKTTLARCIAGLERATSGHVSFGDVGTLTTGKYQRLAVARQVQLIFQDCATALNPRFTGAEIVGEPLVIQGVNRAEITKQVKRLMNAVGLPRGTELRRPLQLSGGQRQRLAIARALALQPSLLILDEAFAGLDLPVQYRILELLAGLQRQFSLTYLLISHDLRLVANVADVIAIMYQGRIVEQGPARDVLRSPQHAHTRALLAAVPGCPLAACRS